MKTDKNKEKQGAASPLVRAASSFTRRPLWLALAGCSVLGVALACGPDFQVFLNSRTAFLKAAIPGNFFRDAAQLHPAPAKKFPNGLEQNTADLQDGKHDPEGQGLNAAQRKGVSEMRAAEQGDQAFALGAALPAAVRLYTAGAVDYRRVVPYSSEAEAVHEESTCELEAETTGAPASAASQAASSDEACPRPVVRAQGLSEAESKDLLAKARQRFEAVLKLPEKERAIRATWAAYSLGLVEIAEAGEGYLAKADAHFELTRKLAAAGAPDPEFLGLDSFGAQARMHLNAGNYTRATELYAEQASHESWKSGESLLIVAQRLLKDEAGLQAHIKSALVQRLLVGYVLSYGDEEPHVEGGEGAKLRPASPLNRLVKALDAAGIQQPAAADKLAAAGYANARYDLARRYVGNLQTPTAHWLRAKLALMAGDKKAAATAFAKALEAERAEEAEDKKLAAEDTQLLSAQFAALKLGSDEFVQALDLLYGQGPEYWIDAAYVAERLLTLDELKTFVDQRAAKAVPAAETGYAQLNNAGALRDLLARRLMREQRFDEALDYFQERELQAVDGGTKPEQARVYAKAYAKALRSAAKAWTQVGRAQSLYEAAEIARWHGMEIMAYEVNPDFAMVGGNYDLAGMGPESDKTRTPAERQRFQATRGEFGEKRFHYRYEAVKLASQAADLLPARSRTYADVLSNAASWVINLDDELTQSLYQRYVKTGAYIAPQGEELDFLFGQLQQEPNFWQARRFVARQSLQEARLWAREHRPLAWGLIALGGFGLLGGLALLRGFVRKCRGAKSKPGAAAEVAAQGQG